MSTLIANRIEADAFLGDSRGRIGSAIRFRTALAYLKILVEVFWRGGESGGWGLTG